MKKTMMIVLILSCFQGLYGQDRQFRVVLDGLRLSGDIVLTRNTFGSVGRPGEPWNAMYANRYVLGSDFMVLSGASFTRGSFEVYDLLTTRRRVVSDTLASYSSEPFQFFPGASGNMLMRYNMHHDRTYFPVFGAPGMPVPIYSRQLMNKGVLSTDSLASTHGISMQRAYATESTETPVVYLDEIDILPSHDPNAQVKVFKGLENIHAGVMFTKSFNTPRTSLQPIGGPGNPIPDIYVDRLHARSAMGGGLSTQSLHLSPTHYAHPAPDLVNDSLLFQYGTDVSNGYNYLEAISTKLVDETNYEESYCTYSLVLPDYFTSFDTIAVRLEYQTETTTATEASFQLSIYKNDLVTSRYNSGYLTSTNWAELKVQPSQISTSYKAGDRFVLQFSYRTAKDGVGNAFFVRTSSVRVNFQ